MRYTDPGKILILLLLMLLAACARQPASTPPPAPENPSAPAPTAAVEPTAATEPTTAVEPTAALEPTSAPTEAAPPTAASPTYQNPVLKNNFPDPFILQEGDTYYAYATNGSGKNVQVATSTDLVRWSMKRDGMPGLAPWVRISSADVWAPEVIKVGDKYLLYYTARHDESGKQCVGVAVGDAPEGRFKDTNEQPLVCQTEEGGTIDASPFRDGEKLYLYYKNDGNCCGLPTYIYVQEMAPDGLSLVGEATRLLRNDEPWEGGVIEAPTMVKHEDGYYLFFSANSYAGFEYAVGYATCETAAGPCTDADENPILASQTQQPVVIGPGHQTIVQLGDETWIVYHAWEFLSSGMRGDRRLVWIDRIDWINGKPDVLGPSTDPQPAPAIP